MDTVAAKKEQKKVEISSAEWQIMRIVWTLKHVTSTEIINLMQQKQDWSDSTIKTLITRLTKKEFLSRKKVNGRYIYSTTVSEQETMDEYANSLFNDFCAHKTGSVLNELIDSLDISKNDIESLQKTLDNKLKTAPEKVNCDCLPDGCEHMC
ncbi:CopY/TcrY family copper transport repressor [Companilactobacillus kimchii]|uniref:Negative regulator of copper transport operon, AtkY n=2 Tax=Companilactobacillus kimchii TaxID=2801452 RepID=A0ABR5NX04_9LACO|nr:CopY/TcrY family copper transport repressor [Companilactobacillus kimchii]KAE9559921.1 penicillinase repressor [Companilactobacillus kimchii]KRK53433.1 negative regulator of copper transport operon, AtkY [Companilactobacillus kimchii DSM 13961 = JCM 10707]OWF33460.1 Methicillin resistance regulatory protein MecI [Companilactobacillus kimchii]GEO46540.1 uracil phosphoribosyltransferase [Companilactobacillus paralimentarius]